MANSNDANQSFSDDEVKRMKADVHSEVQDIVRRIEHDYPGITEGAAAAIGASTGAAGSLAALSALGVPGLSAAGITSGLAAAGSLVGGGMLAGLGVLAAPVAALCVGGYLIAKKHKDAKLAAALVQAISKLYDLQSRLIANAEHFKDELQEIKVFLDMLSAKMPA